MRWVHGTAKRAGSWRLVVEMDRKAGRRIHVVGEYKARLVDSESLFRGGASLLELKQKEDCLYPSVSPASLRVNLLSGWEWSRLDR